MSGQDMRKLMEMAETMRSFPTQEEYQQYVQAFNAGNGAIDYAFRNVMIGDEEQTRMVEDFEDHRDKDDLNSWRNEWKPQLNDQEIAMLQVSLEETDPWNNSAWEDVWIDTLEPYISNKELWNKNQGVWEDVMFAQHQELTYEQFLEDGEYGVY